MTDTTQGTAETTVQPAPNPIYADYDSALVAEVQRIETNLLDTLTSNGMPYESELCLRDYRRTALSNLNAVSSSLGPGGVDTAYVLSYLSTRMEREAEIILNNATGRQTLAHVHARDVWSAALERYRHMERQQRMQGIGR